MRLRPSVQSKIGGDKTCAIGITEANNNNQQANRLRKQLIKIQDVESEISAQMQS